MTPDTAQTLYKNLEALTDPKKALPAVETILADQPGLFDALGIPEGSGKAQACAERLAADMKNLLARRQLSPNGYSFFSPALEGVLAERLRVQRIVLKPEDLVGVSKQSPDGFNLQLDVLKALAADSLAR